MKIRLTSLLILGQNGSIIQYLSLNPAKHIDDLVKESRSLVLLGGTMSPTSNFTTYLFPTQESKAINIFSCDHVIPKENILTLTISHAPSTREIRFTLENRDNENLILDVGQSLCSIARIVPRGMVVFFPSFHSLESTFEIWKSSPCWDRLEKIKKVSNFNLESIPSSDFEIFTNFIVVCIL
jgi:chromosome transmission fidelity protein 1